MDLGRHESIAWKGGYPFWGERDQSEWSDEVQEREKGENGEVRDERVEPGDGGWEEATIAR